MHDSGFDPYNQISHDMAFSSTLLGKECQQCRRALPFTVFDKDSSCKDGRALICPKCKSTPRLSAEENYRRQREANFSSEAIKSQRRENEEDYLDRDPRGRVLTSNEIILRLKKAGVRLVTAPAHFLDEVSLYVEDIRSDNGYIYIGWLPLGSVQEFSEYSYNTYAVPTDEIEHGYRGLLKNLILGKYLTEDKCNKYFGLCDEKVWAKAMWDFRNKK
jgi:hypothetical protein